MSPVIPRTVTLRPRRGFHRWVALNTMCTLCCICVHLQVCIYLSQVCTKCALCILDVHFVHNPLDQLGKSVHRTRHVLFPGHQCVLPKSKIQTRTIFPAEFYSTFILLSTVRHPPSAVHNPPKSVHPTRNVCTGVHSVHSVLRATRR